MSRLTHLHASQVTPKITVKFGFITRSYIGGKVEVFGLAFSEFKPARLAYHLLAIRPCGEYWIVLVIVFCGIQPYKCRCIWTQSLWKLVLYLQQVDLSDDKTALYYSSYFLGNSIHDRCMQFDCWVKGISTSLYLKVSCFNSFVIRCVAIMLLPCMKHKICSLQALMFAQKTSMSNFQYDRTNGSSIASWLIALLSFPRDLPCRLCL